MDLLCFFGAGVVIGGCIAWEMATARQKAIFAMREAELESRIVSERKAAEGREMRIRVAERN